MPGGTEAVDLEEDIPSSYEFLCQLPEQKCKAEEEALIITTLDSISEAQAHMSMATTNLSSLVKITDLETFKLVLRAMVHSMVQLNIPPRFLDPVQDPEPYVSSRPTSKEVGSTVTTPQRCNIIEPGTKEQPDKTTGSGSLAKTEVALSELQNGKGGM